MTGNANLILGPSLIVGGDPLYKDPAQHDFRLQPCSPLVNSGDNSVVEETVDLNGSPRLQGGKVDIGAYETSPPGLSAAPEVTPACQGVSNGAVSFQVNQGCLPLQYQWAGPFGNGVGTNHLSVGNYIFTITDAKGTTLTVPVTIPQGNPLQMSANITPLICGDTTGGQLMASVVGGQLPYSYLLTGYAVQSSGVFSGLAPGNYTITATDSVGCSTSLPVTVNKTGGLNLDVSVIPVSCHGAQDGGFTLAPADGKPPYTWTWDDGFNGPARTGLGPGEYAGTLTDGFGCFVVWQFPLDEPAALGVGLTAIPSTDSTVSNGGLNVTDLFGGTPPYQVVWSNGAMGLDLTDLLPGIYQVTVTDAHGCSAVGTGVVGVSVGSSEPTERRNAVLIYPNPAGSYCYVKLPENSEGFFRLYDGLGRIVLNRWLTDRVSRLDLNRLPEGMYKWIWKSDQTGWIRK